MKRPVFVTAPAFADAFAQHFGLPKHCTMTRMTIDVQPDMILAAQVSIAMSADDLAAISAIMKRNQQTRDMQRINQIMNSPLPPFPHGAP